MAATETDASPDPPVDAFIVSTEGNEIRIPLQTLAMSAKMIEELEKLEGNPRRLKVAFSALVIELANTFCVYFDGVAPDPTRFTSKDTVDGEFETGMYARMGFTEATQLMQFASDFKIQSLQTFSLRAIIISESAAKMRRDKENPPVHAVDVEGVEPPIEQLHKMFKSSSAK